MSPLLETVLFIFGVVALGYGAGRSGYIRAEVGEALSEFAVAVAMPLVLFRTLAQADFHGSVPWRFWAVYFAAVVVAWTAGHLVMTRGFGRDSRAGVVGGVSAAFSNLVLLGIPFVLGVFGQRGVEELSLLIAIHLPTMLMASMLLFARATRAAGEKMHPLRVARDFLRKVLSNPLILGILAGTIWRSFDLQLGGLGARFVDSLAGIAAPLALFAMGLGLNRFALSGTLAPATALSALKLGLMPAAALLFAWMAGLPPMTAQIAVAAAALPSGVNSYLIAVQFGTGQALASNQISIATLLAAATTTFWLSVARLVFG